MERQWIAPRAGARSVPSNGGPTWRRSWSPRMKQGALGGVGGGRRASRCLGTWRPARGGGRWCLRGWSMSRGDLASRADPGQREGGREADRSLDRAAALHQGPRVRRPLRSPARVGARVVGEGPGSARVGPRRTARVAAAASSASLRARWPVKRRRPAGQEPRGEGAAETDVFRATRAAIRSDEGSALASVRACAGMVAAVGSYRRVSARGGWPWSCRCGRGVAATSTMRAGFGPAKSLPCR